MKRLIVLAIVLFTAGSLRAATDTTKLQDKDSYLAKADREVQDWTAKLKSLEASSETTGAKTRDELDKRIKVVDENLVTARKKLDELHMSSQGAWGTMRKSLDETLDKVKGDYQKALAYFNKSEKKVVTTKKKEGL